MGKIKHISNRQIERRLIKTIKEMKRDSVGEWLLNNYEEQLKDVKVSIAKEEQKQEIFF